MLKVSKKYKVRVVYLGYRGDRQNFFYDGLTLSEALDRFLFYVRLAVELGMSIETVNVFLGKRCLYLYTKH